MNIYEQLIEEDLNPFILFNSNGKVLNFNKEAEFLFNYVETKELFNLALTHASSTFGFKKEFINLKYQKQSFYALLVGYIDDDEIVLRLYKEVIPIVPINIDDTFQFSNIYELIDLSKNTTLLDSDLKLDELYDTSLPEIKININMFLLNLNAIFEHVKNKKQIQIKVHIKIGEYEIIDGKKRNMLAIDFIGNDKMNFSDKMTNDNQKSKITIFDKENMISMEVPLIF